MARLLHIDSSALSSGSVSKEVAATFRAEWEKAHPGGTVVYRDLGAEPVPALSEAGIFSTSIPQQDHSPEHAAAYAVRVGLVQELLDADAYLLTVPMYNWGLPSTFKAWLDQVILVGRTVDFSGEPPLAGRPATVVLSYGGGYDAGTPREGWDFVQPYLEVVLGKALSLDVTFIKTQLTLAEVNPAMAELIPVARRQRADAHTRAEERAREVARQLTGLAAA